MTSEGIVGGVQAHLWAAGQRDMYHLSAGVVFFKTSLLSNSMIMLHISVALHLFTLRKYLNKSFDKYFLE